MILNKCYSLLCIALLYIPTSCFAWWDEGHMIITQIAYNNLTKTTRNSVNDLLNYPLDFPHINSSTSYLPEPKVLNQQLNTLVLASPWPDGIISYHWTNPAENDKYAELHYLDVSINYLDMADCSHPETSWINKIHDNISNHHARKEGNTIDGIKSSIKTLITPTESKINQGVALRYLIHLAGDLHQPFHASEPTFVYTDPKTHKQTVVHTQGANNIVTPKITISNYMPYSGQPEVQNISSWHAFWDTAAGAYENIDSPIDSERAPHSWENGWSPVTAPTYRKAYLDYIAKQAQSIETICQNIPDLKSDVSMVSWAAVSSETSCKLLAPNNFGFEFEPYETGLPSEPYKVKLLNFNVTSYEQSTRLIAKMHICMAGYRLANLLNAIYDPAAAPIAYNKYLAMKIKRGPAVAPLAQYIQSLL